jgi:hypothetical protein
LNSLVLASLLELVLFVIFLSFLFLFIWTIRYEMAGLATFITCPLLSFSLILIIFPYKFLENLMNIAVSSSLDVSTTFFAL